MLAQMRNDALRNVPDAYPRILASAFRIASQWTNEESSKPAGVPAAAAYVTEEVHVTLSKDTVKDTAKIKKQRKKIPAASITCYVCSALGHYARMYPERKSPTDKVLVTKPGSSDDEVEPLADEWDVALVMKHEACMFKVRRAIG